jgi:hypothetical protein
LDGAYPSKIPNNAFLNPISIHLYKGIEVKMGAVRNVAIVVLLISFLTFVAFFGRLPVLR